MILPPEPSLPSASTLINSHIGMLGQSIWNYQRTTHVYGPLNLSIQHNTVEERLILLYFRSGWLAFSRLLDSSPCRRISLSAQDSLTLEVEAIWFPRCAWTLLRIAMSSNEYLGKISTAREHRLRSFQHCIEEHGQISIQTVRLRTFFPRSIHSSGTDSAKLPVHEKGY